MNGLRSKQDVKSRTPKSYSCLLLSLPIPSSESSQAAQIFPAKFNNSDYTEISVNMKTKVSEEEDIQSTIGYSTFRSPDSLEECDALLTFLQLR